MLLKSMLRFFHAEYHFFPQSWSLPKETAALHAFMADHPTALILKPNRGCQGVDNYLPLPPGYALAPPDADTIAVIAAHGWSTRCAVTADGGAWPSGPGGLIPSCWSSFFFLHLSNLFRGTFDIGS